MTTTAERFSPSTTSYEGDKPANNPDDPRFDDNEQPSLFDVDENQAPETVDNTLESPTDNSPPVNVYDRVVDLMTKFSEGTADRKETRMRIKNKLIGFGKSALRVTATTGAIIVGAPFVAVGATGYLAYKGAQKGVEVAKDVASTVKDEASYVANEIKGDFITAKDEAKTFFKEKAANAIARKNARLEKIKGGYNELHRRRRALGARALSIVDRARTVKDAAKSAWNETGAENSLY